MKRLMLIYNPRSSNYATVEREVLEKTRHLKGWMIGKFEIADTNVDDNAARLARVLKDRDLVVAAGGDGTATIAMNAIMKSNHPNIRFAVLGYGNFNDMARSFGELTFDEALKSRKSTPAYPLECRIDGKHFRYGMCYFTIGMFAAACAVFDVPEVRKKLRSKHKKPVIYSIFTLADWWRRHHKDRFLPNFTLERPSSSPTTILGASDYVAINAPSMAKVLRGRKYFSESKNFRSVTGNLSKFLGLMRIILPAIFREVPGTMTSADTLLLKKPAKIMFQAEGEYKNILVNQKIEILKSTRPIQVVTK
jgi:diacylglycerol kinase family enzyme